MNKIVEECKKEFENKIRVGFIGYRSHRNGEDRIIRPQFYKTSQPFTLTEGLNNLGLYYK
jgi:hypothetical protein